MKQHRAIRSNEETGLVFIYDIFYDIVDNNLVIIEMNIYPVVNDIVQECISSGVGEFTSALGKHILEVDNIVWEE